MITARPEMNDPPRPKLGTLVLRIGSAVAATATRGFYTDFASAFSDLGTALGLPLFVVGGILILGLAPAANSARRSGVSAAVASVGVLGLAFAAASGLRLPLYFATDDFELDSETAITRLLAVAAAVPTFGWPSAGSDAVGRRARRITLVFLAAFAASCAAYG